MVFLCTFANESFLRWCCFEQFLRFFAILLCARLIRIRLPPPKNTLDKNIKNSNNQIFFCFCSKWKTRCSELFENHRMCCQSGKCGHKKKLDFFLALCMPKFHNLCKHALFSRFLNLPSADIIIIVIICTFSHAGILLIFQSLCSVFSSLFHVWGNLFSHFASTHKTFLALLLVPCFLTFLYSHSFCRNNCVVFVSSFGVLKFRRIFLLPIRCSHVLFLLFLPVLVFFSSTTFLTFHQSRTKMKRTHRAKSAWDCFVSFLLLRLSFLSVPFFCGRIFFFRELVY